MTKDELASKLKQEVKGLDTYLDTIDYQNACDDASRETGWSYPVSTDFKIFWMKERGKRHLFFYLMSESAHKFKYKQISLQHRFDHYSKIIKMMDVNYEKTIEENPQEFTDSSAVHAFGNQINAGFVYEDGTGRDETYNEDIDVRIKPDDSD